MNVETRYSYQYYLGVAILVSISLLSTTACTTINSRHASSEEESFSRPSLLKQDSEEDDTQPHAPFAQTPEPIYLEDDQELAAEPNTDENDVLLNSAVSQEQDLWDRIRTGFKLDMDAKKHAQVTTHVHWYTKHPRYIERTFSRARPFLFEIVEKLEAKNFPLEIALLPVVESAFQPFAYSHGRAAGLWQFIPGTAKQYGLTIDWWHDERRDILASTDAAVTYLSNLSKRFDGDWLLALAAYNSGEGTVERAIKKNKQANKPTDFWNLALPKETRGYVPRLLAISNIIEHPSQYKVSLKSIPNEPQLGIVDVGSQIDIALAAELADMTIDEIYNLNPAINRWATPADGPHTLLLPKDKIAAFNQNLLQLPANKRVEWRRHKVKSGETLGHIAHKYNTTPAVLAQVNDLTGSLIRANQHLIIPVAQRSEVTYRLSADQRMLATKNTSRSGKQKIVHVVRKGDTLWDIAQKHRVGVTSLSSWNGMAPKDPLRIGQQLVVWKKHSSVTAHVTSTSDNKKTQRIAYTVRKGDSLSKIAAIFNLTVTKIENWNSRLRQQKYLRPGQVLTLFVDITRTTETG